MTPDETLLRFLDNLPAIIKERVLFQVCWGMGMRDIVEIARRDYVNQLREMLDDEETAKYRPYKCAQIIGVVELVLQPEDFNLEQSNMNLYEETGVKAFRDAALRQPLAEQNAEAALEEFRKLRKDELSPQALRTWQSLLILSSQPE